MMSETLLKVLLSELQTVRLICQHCRQAAVERPTEKLAQLHTRDTFCPLCNMAFPRG